MTGHACSAIVSRLCAALTSAALRLAWTTRSQAVVFRQALDSGVERGLSVAVGLETFFQTKPGPSSQAGCFFMRLAVSTVDGVPRGDRVLVLTTWP